MEDRDYVGRTAPYPAVAPQPNIPAIEESILEFWKQDETFAASVRQRTGGDNEYVFYDGPPFANGLPHYGHLLTGFVKDAVPRYQTMRGRRVERRFGWDCHGLPAEMTAEKELGVTGRAGVEELGIDQFNDHCRVLAMRTKEDWRRYVTRQARWVDFDDDYKTMDTPYMESVLWAFKRLWEKGYIYEGFRVLPYCWECETPLSNFETRLDDAYRLRVDPAATIAFSLDPLDQQGHFSTVELSQALSGSVRLLAWTTTPWTLPSNLALAVGGDIDYFVVDTPDGITIASKEWWHSRLAGPNEPDKSNDADEAASSNTLIGVIKGSEIVGRRYRPLFDFFDSAPNAFVVLEADFVSTEEGTGVVHMAPGFGEDDQRACEAAGIAVIAPVSDTGVFTSQVGQFGGMQVFDANKPILEHLRSQRGVVAEVQEYEHSYPHCWRTDTPLIYRAMSSWFVQVTAIRDRMLELNDEINWIPAHVRNGAFGKWLAGARDWSISRNRFWGAPIPVWKSDDPAYPRIDVYGSLEELQKDFGSAPDELHRPAIDQLTRPNPDDPTGRSTMKRVSDVLDCWFESGSMPFAQLHYPFENAERFEQHFPADFIVEYLGQTRGWFYTLHVLATGLFDRPPFETCMAHGIVLGHDGRKMSKRLGNYPDPEEVFAKWGADTLRWFMLSSAVLRGQDLVVDEQSIAEAQRQAIQPLWNAWNFLALYANADGVKATYRTDATGLLDKWILAEAAHMVSEVQDAMDKADLPVAAAAVQSFVEGLTNWYVRRSRERFWRPVQANVIDQDKLDAYDTLGTVLGLCCQAAAPMLPLITEAVWKGLTSGRSVHLTDWPDAASLPHDPELRTGMNRVRSVCSAGHSIRKAASMRTRLPLATLTICAPWAEQVAPYAELIAEELNVREVRLSSNLEEVSEESLAVEPAALGPRLGPATQKVIAAVRKGEWELTAEGDVRAAGFLLQKNEYRLVLNAKDSRAGRALATGDAVVTLDLNPGPELLAEGMARDAIRAIQESRKAAALNVSDRIHLKLAVPVSSPEVRSAMEEHRQLIMAQVLAVDVEVVDLDTSNALHGNDNQEMAEGSEVPPANSAGEFVWRTHRLGGTGDVAVWLARAD